jgi:hypothetical protein
MRGKLPVAIVATMSLALVVLASEPAWAPPKWRGAQFKGLPTAQGLTKNLQGAPNATRPSVVAGAPKTIRVELNRSVIPKTLARAVPSDVRSAVWRACTPGKQIVMESDAFTPRRATAVIASDGATRYFTLAFTPRPVPSGQDLKPAWAWLVSCGGQKFTFDPAEGGVGEEFAVVSPLAFTGRPERTTALVGLALILAGGLLLFVGRTRRRERPAG